MVRLDISEGIANRICWWIGYGYEGKRGVKKMTKDFGLSY